MSQENVENVVGVRMALAAFAGGAKSANLRGATEAVFERRKRLADPN